MPPQQQPYGPPTGPAPSYDFILNSGQKPRRQLPGNSSQQRLLIVAGGAVLLLVLFIIFSKILAGSDSFTPAMTSVVQSQQELLHLTDSNALDQLGATNSLSGSDKNFIGTAQLALTSAQNDIIAYVAASGHKLNPKLFSLKESPATDKQLGDAAQAGTFDATYHEVMQTELRTYQTSLQRAAQVSGPQGRALLQADYNQADLLLKQLNVQ